MIHMAGRVRPRDATPCHMPRRRPRTRSSPQRPTSRPTKAERADGRDVHDAGRLPAAERLLVGGLAEVGEARRVLAVPHGRAQAAAAAAGTLPHAAVRAVFLDGHAASAARAAQGGGPANLHIDCATDLPLDAAEPADAVLLAVSRAGEAELTREWINQAHLALRPGGKLLAATDNPDDRWLHAELRRLFRKVSKRPGTGGVLYVAVRDEAAAKAKPYVTASFAFRVGERIVQLESRPGVFAHRRVDGGARALIDAMTVPAGSRVLDIGCGSGAVALAAALHAPDVEVTAIDTNARAVACTIRGAEKNGLTGRVRAEVVAAEAFEDARGFDVVLGNPPYYSGYRIAGAFLACARRALRSGGRVYMVAKATAWYEQEMPLGFDNVQSVPSRGYTVFVGTQRPTTSA